MTTVAKKSTLPKIPLYTLPHTKVAMLFICNNYENIENINDTYNHWNQNSMHSPLFNDILVGK